MRSPKRVPVLLLILGIALPALALGPPARLIQNHAALVTAAGSVEASDPADAWKALSGQTTLSAGSRIRTGADGSASIRIGDFGMIELGANSEMNLLEMKQMEIRVIAVLFLQRKVPRDQVEVELARGEAAFRLVKQPMRKLSFKVYTPRGAVELEPGVYEVKL